MNSARIHSFTFSLLTVALFSCGRSATSNEKTSFSKADSLTEKYLSLQDTLLHVWNKLVHDENQKITAIENVLAELNKQSALTSLGSLETRFNQIKEWRITHKTLSNHDVLEEYDFAHQSLISELFAASESYTTISATDFQQLLDEIKLAEGKVNLNRADYDSIAQAFNLFLEKHQAMLKEIDQTCNTEQRPLFNSVAKK
jgi:hypothetical protein